MLGCYVIHFLLTSKDKYSGDCCSGREGKVTPAFVRYRVEDLGLGGALTRGGRAEQEREAERRVRAACRAGASPGGMWGCGSLGSSLRLHQGLQSITNNHRQPVDGAMHRHRQHRKQRGLGLSVYILTKMWLCLSWLDHYWV